MPTVTVHNDFYPDDEVFELPVFGAVTNHEAKEVDDLAVETFKAQGFSWGDEADLVINIGENSPPVEYDKQTPAKVDGVIKLDDVEVDNLTDESEEN